MRGPQIDSHSLISAARLSSVGALLLAAAACGREPLSSGGCVSRIAYTAAASTQNVDIFSWNADGSGIQRLTRTGVESSPAWSRDGRRIAFVSARISPPRIWLMNADGSGQVALNSTAVGVPSHPSWSADGRLIAYERYDSSMSQIFVVGADGSNPRQLTGLADGSRSWEPAWSPDGGTITFTSNRGDVSGGVFLGRYRQVWLMNADGSNPRQITNLPGDQWTPAWSPDGTRIAFASGSYRQAVLYVMGADGSNPTRVTADTSIGYQWAPSWSPDGLRIAFQSLRPEQPASVMIINADATNPTLFSYPQEDSGEPAWSGCLPR